MADLDREKDEELKDSRENDGESTQEEARSGEPDGSDESNEQTGGNAESAEDGDSEDVKKKSRLFGKKEKKKDKKDQQSEELTDKVMRQMAEFDNFRKRTEKEKAQMFDSGAGDIIEKILPVVDNFERGLAAVPEEDKGAPFAEGMEKIYRQLMKTLEDAGVKPIEAVGQPFDPNFHNAVMHIDDESLGENTIAMELQKGYTYRDTVVRHSMVQVAN